MESLSYITGTLATCTKSIGYVADTALNITKLAIPIITGYDNSEVNNISQDPLVREEIMNALRHATSKSLIMSPSARAFVRIAGLSGISSIALGAYGSHGNNIISQCINLY